MEFVRKSHRESGEVKFIPFALLNQIEEMKIQIPDNSSPQPDPLPATLSLNTIMASGTLIMLADT